MIWVSRFISGYIFQRINHQQVISEPPHVKSFGFIWFWFVFCSFFFRLIKKNKFFLFGRTASWSHGLTASQLVGMAGMHEGRKSGSQKPPQKEKKKEEKNDRWFHHHWWWDWHGLMTTPPRIATIVWLWHESACDHQPLGPLNGLAVEWHPLP